MRMIVSIEEKSTITLFNPGSQENLIRKESTRRLRVILRKQKQLIQLYKIKEQIITNKLITEDIKLIKLQIRDYKE
jgi:hypothetical protein